MKKLLFILILFLNMNSNSNFCGLVIELIIEVIKLIHEIIKMAKNKKRY